MRYSSGGLTALRKMDLSLALFNLRTTFTGESATTWEARRSTLSPVIRSPLVKMNAASENPVPISVIPPILEVSLLITYPLFQTSPNNL